MGVASESDVFSCKKMRHPDPNLEGFFTKFTRYAPNPGTFHEFLQQGHCSSLQQLVGILLGAECNSENDFYVYAMKIARWSFIYLMFLDEPNHLRTTPYKVIKFLNWGTPCERIYTEQEEITRSNKK